MGKNNTKFIYVFLTIMLLCVLSGCGSDSSETATESIDEGMNTYSVYYINSDWSDFSIQDINIDQMEVTENVIDMLMNELITANDNESCQIPVASGMSYQRYSYDGQGSITLMFNVDYESIEQYQVLLSKTAFTKTLCQVADVNGVVFELSDLIGEREVDISEYNEDSFSTVDDDIMESEYDVEIYVLDSSKEQLEKTTLEIDGLLYTAPEEQIMEALKSSDKWISPISDDLDVLDVYVDENICYVNFGCSNAEDVELFNNDLYIYSIVNSLTSLDNITSVSFFVNGSREGVYGDALDLYKDYTADYSYCKE